MAGKGGRKEKEFNLRELTNLDSLGDTLTEIKSSCIEGIQGKTSLLWDTIESNLEKANEILFGEAKLSSELPLVGKQQVHEIDTSLNHNENGALNAGSTTKQTQEMPDSKWKFVLSSVQSKLRLEKITAERNLMKAVAKIDLIAKDFDMAYQKMENGSDDIIAQNFAFLLVKYQANSLMRSLYRLNPFSLLNYAFGDANPSQVSPNCLVRDDMETIEPRYSTAALGKNRTFYKSVVLAYDNVTELGGQYYSNIAHTANNVRRKISRPAPGVIAGQLQEIIRKAKLGSHSEATLGNVPATYNAVDKDSQVHPNEVKRDSNSIYIYGATSTNFSLVVYVVITSAFYVGFVCMFYADLLQDNQPPH